MPTLSQAEMNLLLDPELLRQAEDHDEEALRSQLMANLEHNNLAYGSNANLQSQPFDEHYVPYGGVEGQEDVEIDNAEFAIDPALEEGQPIQNVQPEGRHKDVEDTELDIEAQAYEMSLDGKRTEAEPDPIDTESEDTEQEEEEYEDASFTIGMRHEHIAEVNDSASESASEVDPGDASDASDASEDLDEDVDLCLFCDQKEPEDETTTEVDLTCAVCRRPAHAACARSKEISPEDVQSWRCPSCTRNQTSESPKEMSVKPRHSAPRLIRDLLPVSRGVQKPGAHSIFAQPLIQDDEGGRALRKRKSPSVEPRSKTDKSRKKMKETPKPEDVEEPEPVSHSTRRSSQKLVLGLPPPPIARILQHRPFHKPPPHKFILAFRLEQSKIASILAEKPRPGRRRHQYTRKRQKILPPAPFQPPIPKFPALPTGHLIFPTVFGDRENEINAKPYGGVLSEAEAETSRSLPQMRDREIFEIARKEAEEERKRTSAKAEAEMNGLNGEGANATNSKRTVSGPPSKIKCIQFGKYVIDTSYAAPYPEEYSHESRLFICEFCLKYLPSEFVAWRHKLKCPAKHPPGDEIYRDGSLSIWEVDGRKKTEYCQCLCLMAKLFLGSKTLYYDVDPFLFYVLTEYDELGYHFVGYFSKEKRPASQNNVSCILVMPIHQRKGYATFLIEFSYLLTRIEGKEGSPEKPLSDMGLTAYRSYWDLTISRHLLRLDKKPFSVKDIMARTGMTADDVVHSLERLYAFIKDPVTKAYAIRYDKQLYETIVDKYESKDFRQIRPERLMWTPYIMGRSDTAALDAQPISTIARREESEKPEAEEGSDHISPKSKEPTAPGSPEVPIDPALFNDLGNIAPGPPAADAMNGVQPNTSNDKVEEVLTNGISEKEKAPTDGLLTGYALVYRTENIPATRFQIDPPIPPAMLRHANAMKRKKSTAGTPRTNGISRSKPTTPQAVRSSPRKAGSVNGVSRAGSRATSPDRGSAIVRRSGRKSGLANEIVTSNDEDTIMDDADEDEEDEEGDEITVQVADDQEMANGDSEDGSGSDDDTNEHSEDSSAELDEDSGVSDDPDAEVDEEEEEESEEEEDEGVEVDIPSVASGSAVSSEDEASESAEED